MSVYALIATVPPRRDSCARLLAELVQQTRKPDGAILVLDGYGSDDAPACALPAFVYRTAKPRGAGGRWRVAKDFQSDDILVCVDDDIMLTQAPRFIEALAAAVKTGGGAAAAMGRTMDGTFAPPGEYSCGDLIHGLGCGLALRARHLAGLEDFAATITDVGGPDMLGLNGDDDALVSAYLWKQGVRILHAAAGNIFEAPNTQPSSATPHTFESFSAQKRQLAQITGWPWRASG